MGLFFRFPLCYRQHYFIKNEPVYLIRLLSTSLYSKYSNIQETLPSVSLSHEKHSSKSYWRDIRRRTEQKLPVLKSSDIGIIIKKTEAANELLLPFLTVLMNELTSRLKKSVNELMIEQCATLKKQLEITSLYDSIQSLTLTLRPLLTSCSRKNLCIIRHAVEIITDLHNQSIHYDDLNQLERSLTVSLAFISRLIFYYPFFFLDKKIEDKTTYLDLYTRTETQLLLRLKDILTMSIDLNLYNVINGLVVIIYTLSYHKDPDSIALLAEMSACLLKTLRQYPQFQDSLSTHTMSLILSATSRNQEEPMKHLHLLGCQILQHLGKPFLDLEDILRSVTSFVITKQFDDRPELLIYCIKESSRFVTELKYKPSQLLYFIQVFGIAMSKIPSSLEPEFHLKPLNNTDPCIQMLSDCKSTNEVNISARDSTKTSDLFSLNIDNEFTKSTSRRTDPSKSLQTAIGSLGDAYKHIIKESELSPSDLVQIVQCYCIPSPFLRKSPKLLRRILRIVNKEINYFSLDLLVSLFTCLNILVDKFSQFEPITIQKISWRQAIQQRQPTHTIISDKHQLSSIKTIYQSIQESFIQRLEFELSDYKKNSGKNESETVSKHPDGYNLILPNALHWKHKTTMLLTSPEAPILIIRILMDIDIINENIMIDMSSYLIANKAFWLYRTLQNYPESLTILSDYYHRMKQYFEAKDLSLHNAVDILKKTPYATVGKVPLQIIIVYDILQDFKKKDE